MTETELFELKKGDKLEYVKYDGTINLMGHEVGEICTVIELFDNPRYGKCIQVKLPNGKIRNILYKHKQNFRKVKE